MIRVLRSLAPVLVLAVSLPAQSQGTAAGVANSTTSGHTVPVPSARAVRRNTQVVLDGALNDAAWQAATPVTDFLQTDPSEGQPATQRTEMRFLYDEGALYIGAKMYDTQGHAGVRTSLVRRDAGFNSDYIEVVIDGFHDHLGRAFFQVNPSGSKFDMLGIGTSCCDEGWDPIWEAATRIDNEGWSAEIRIPLSQLKFPASSSQTWGLQLRRWIHRNNELDQWSFWRKNEPGGPQRFGHLEGLEFNGRSGRALELLPYVAAKNQNLAVPNGDPFNSGNVKSVQAGLDLKYNLSSNFTLDATFNPDFGQVEADPAVVNLTAFETSFPEKRPFFIASSGVFGYGSFNCYFCSNVSSLSAFYSRRIGRSPQGADIAYGAGVYADIPEATTILGAAKVTGRTANGLTIGILNAVTGREEARVQDSVGNNLSRVVEPLTNYFVGRVKKDLMRGNLVLGGIATSTLRDMEPEFVPRLTRHAELVGTDVRYTFKERNYSLSANFAITNIEGDPAVISARQRNSARYFQRPDRKPHDNGGFLTDELDPTATVMRGAAAYARLGKDAGNWMWETSLNMRTPGFENNDLAFLTRADYLWYNANIFRYWSKPTKWYRDLSIIVGGQQQQNFDGDINDQQVHAFVGTTAPNFWNFNLYYVGRPDLMDERLLRGGPVVQRPATWAIGSNMGTDARGRVNFNAYGEYARNSIGGWGKSIGAGVTYRPKPNATVSLNPNWNNSRSMLQYVRRSVDATNEAFYGSRYVLASIDQKQLGLETRLNWTFSPTTSIELYAQPLLASGDYFDYKEYDAPRSLDLSVYGRDKGTITETPSQPGGPTIVEIDPDASGPAPSIQFANPDFNFRSLRGNAVFRWEYRPGSVMYVAWAHSRSGNLSQGDFQFRRDFNAMFQNVPDNVFLVKASFWIPR